MIDFSDTNKLIDKVRFYLEIDFKKEEDIVLLQEVILELTKKKISELRKKKINNLKDKLDV